MCIKILYVEDHKLFLDGVKNVFLGKDRFDLITTFCPHEAENYILSRQFDVYILDIEIQEKDGFYLIDVIRKINFAAKIIVLTYHNSNFILKRLKKLNIDCYLDKNISKMTLISSIERVVKGEKIKFSIKDDLAISCKLTKREVDVLKLILMEKTTNEISDLLDISAYTVNEYRKRLLEKTESKNSVGLAKFAIINKII